MLSKDFTEWLSKAPYCLASGVDAEPVRVSYRWEVPGLDQLNLLVGAGAVTLARDERLVEVQRFSLKAP